MDHLNLRLPETGFVRLPTILGLIPVSKSTVWKRVRSGEFPKPVKFGSATMWKVEDIRALVARMGGEQN